MTRFREVINYIQNILPYIVLCGFILATILLCLDGIKNESEGVIIGALITLIGTSLINIFSSIEQEKEREFQYKKEKRFLSIKKYEEFSGKVYKVKINMQEINTLLYLTGTNENDVEKLIELNQNNKELYKDLEDILSRFVSIHFKTTPQIDHPLQLYLSSLQKTIGLINVFSLSININTKGQDNSDDNPYKDSVIASIEEYQLNYQNMIKSFFDYLNSPITS